MEERSVLGTKDELFLIEEYADIYQMPEVRPSSETTALIGDLHGNAIKLIYFLIREGILELDADPEKYPENLRHKITGNPKDLYKELVKIYEKDADNSKNSLGEILNFADLYRDLENINKTHPEVKLKSVDEIDQYITHRSNLKEHYFKNIAPQLEKEDLEFFKAALANAKITIKRRVMLIGDEFFDRGKNDYFTLLAIKKLKTEASPYEIIVSNHGAEFYGIFSYVNASYENEEEKQANLKLARDNRYASSDVLKTVADIEKNSTRLVFKNTSLDIKNDQSISAHNLGALIQRGLITDEEVEELIKDCCFPRLKLFSYIETQDGKLGICSHAPIGFETIEGMAKALGVKFETDLKTNPETIKNIIDQINDRFNKALAANMSMTDLLTIGAYITDASTGRLLKDQVRIIENSNYEIYESYKTQGIDLSKLAYFFYRTTWNRSRDELDRPENSNVFWVNGHDKKSNIKKYDAEICLDNDSGKKISDRAKIGPEINKWENYSNQIKQNDDRNLKGQAIRMICREVSLDENADPKDRAYARNLAKNSFEKKAVTKQDLLFLRRIMRLQTIKFAEEVVHGKFLSLNDQKELKDDSGNYIVLRLNEKNVALKNEPQEIEMTTDELEKLKKSQEERRAKLHTRKERLAKRKEEFKEEPSVHQHSIWQKSDIKPEKQEDEAPSQKQEPKQEK